MLEILLLLSMLFVFGNVNINKGQEEEEEEETKEDNKDEEEDEKENKDEEDEEVEEIDEQDFDLSKYKDKKLSELDENILSMIMEQESIDLDSLLEAIKQGNDKNISSFIKAKEDEKSDEDQPDKDEAESKTEAKPITVDDSYIQKFIAEIKQSFNGSEEELNQTINDLTQILSGIKGESMTGKALQNYINGQLYIKKIKSPLDKDWQMPEESKTEEYIKQAESIKNKTLAEKIKQVFPDYPDDPADENAVMEFEESLSRRDFARYQKLYEEEKTKIDKEFDRYFYISNNWEKIAIDTIKADLNLFENKLKEAGLSAKDLGLDLTIDAEGYNKFIYDNILLPNGKINDKLVHYIGNTVPVIEPRAIYKELMDLFFNDIIETAKHKGKSVAYREAQKDIPEPSGTHKSKSGLLDNEEEVKVFDDFDADEEVLDKYLNKIKKKILRG